MFKDRLKSAIDVQGHGVAEFQRRLEAERENAFELTSDVAWSNVPTSLATIFRYLNGDSEPGASWLNLASVVLKVELEWLVVGSGPRTPKEAQARKTASSLDTAFEAGTGFTHSGSDKTVVTALRDVFGELLASLPDGAFGVGPEQARDLAMMLQDAMLEPAHAVAPSITGRGKTPILSDQERWHTYCTLVILAMNVAMRPPGENISADELLERWHLFQKFDEDAFALEKARLKVVGAAPTVTVGQEPEQEADASGSEE